MAVAAPAHNSKETILVVDDEASIRRILETRLSMIGYNVVTCLLYTSPSPRDA